MESTTLINVLLAVLGTLLTGMGAIFLNEFMKLSDKVSQVLLRLETHDLRISSLEKAESKERCS